MVIIKVFFLLDSVLSLNFWVEAINIANYLQTKMSTKSSKREFIPKKLELAKYKILVILKLLKILFALKCLKK